MSLPGYLVSFSAKPDRTNFFGIARGSAQQRVPLLELARRRALLNDAEYDAMKSHLEEIARMPSGLINGLDNRTMELLPR